MGAELTQEEKDKAAKLAEEAGKEKSSLDKIGDQLTGVTELLKSHVEKKVEEQEPETEPIDFSKVDAAEMAKSFGADLEKAKDFIKELTEACGVNPQEMFSPDGDRFISDEMLKSLQEAETQSEKYLAGIVYSIQETNERNAVKDAVILQTIATLAKSVSDMHAELQKSMTKENGKEGDTEKDKADPPKGDDELKLPTLDASDPLSELDTQSNLSKGFVRGDLQKSIKSNFFSKSRNDAAQLKKYYEYSEIINKFDPEDALAQITRMNEEDGELIRNHILS